MVRKLDDVMAALPKARRERIEARAMELATLKDLRQAAQQTQEQLAAALGVGQDTISRLEKRSDMLLSTLRHYVESMGGELNLVAQFPNRPPVVIEHLGAEPVRTRNLAPVRAVSVRLLNRSRGARCRHRGQSAVFRNLQWSSLRACISAC